MGKTYFAILGVGSDASSEEIRSAYRRLAKEFHPDRFGGGDSGAFRQIQEAYSVLIDNRRRREYEQSLAEPSGITGFRRYSKPQPFARRHRRAPIRDFSPLNELMGELFEWLGNDFFEPRSAPVQNFSLEVPLTDELAHQGGRLVVSVPARMICSTCAGNGGLGRYACSRCLGQGTVMEDVPLTISFPPGMQTGQTVIIPLERVGLRNARLTVVLVDSR